LKKPKSKSVPVWVSNTLLPYLDAGVKKSKSNRAQFIRDAIREKLTRHGIPLK
jgi:metal-responsive CopG/Arc/MetJ family transcriptional regulator